MERKARRTAAWGPGGAQHEAEATEPVRQAGAGPLCGPAPEPSEDLKWKARAPGRGLRPEKTKGVALEGEAGYDRNMHNGSGSIKISLRLADGEFYPLFRQGDPDTRLMTLSPASPDQGEADIQFFYHPQDGGRPVRIGVIRFPNLPVEDEGAELQLKVVLGSTGLLSADVFHEGSGRSEGLEMPLPEETSSVRGEGLFDWRRGRMARILGVIFVAASLALLLLLARNVSGWGSRAVQPAPVTEQAANGDS